MRKVRKGDDVIVLTGKDKGRRGPVVQVLPNEKVVVENINVVKRHTKPNPNKGVEGGIVKKEMPIHISNIALYNPVTKKADRVGIKELEDGRRVRFFKSTNEVVDV
ncbi:MAG: 50S ribosomal protein L24 [Gammaproteobacteria bacterium]|nr:50S ribosomal protein L24 [Gammaproteobacteria bacterium]